MDLDKTRKRGYFGKINDPQPEEMAEKGTDTLTIFGIGKKSFMLSNQLMLRDWKEIKS